MLFDICQMLSEINCRYLPRKGTRGTKEILKHEDFALRHSQDGETPGAEGLEGI